MIKRRFFTIHGFCQNVLQTYPFESGSSFQQEFLNDSSLIEEGCEGLSVQPFPGNIREEDKELLRGFLKSSGTLEDAVVRLVKITMDELDGSYVIRDSR